MALLLGILEGFAVRRAGFGLDWRFPVLAAVFAAAGSLVGNIIVTAAFSAPQLGTDTFTVLRNLTALTWPVFLDEVMTPADMVFALFAAGLAAFYANRRLTRAQYLAVRTWEKKRRIRTDVKQALGQTFQNLFSYPTTRRANARVISSVC